MKFLKILVLFTLLITSTNCQLSSSNYEGNCGKLETINGDYRTYAPFIAGIFTRSADTPKFFTTGIIIGPTAILAVARGPFGGQFRGQKSDNRLPPPNVFVVFTGLNSTDHTQTDEFTQVSQVNYLEPHLDQEETNEHYHYIIYHLKTVLDLRTPYVKAICLPYFPSKSYTPFGWEFQFSGFTQVSTQSPSNVSHELRITKILTSTEEECYKLFKFHYKHELDESQVFCGQNKLTSAWTTSAFGRDLSNKTKEEPNDDKLESVSFRVAGDQNSSSTSDLCFLHGSALTVFFNGRWRLMGIVTLIPGRRRTSSSSRRCNKKTVYFYGRLPNHHVDWMASSLHCSPHRFPCGDPEGTCLALSSVCNGISQCSTQKDEHELLCEALYQCTNDTMHSCGLQDKCIAKGQVCDKNPDCDDESDESPEFCSPMEKAQLVPTNQTNVFCPPLKLGKGVVAKCVDLENSEDFNCEERSGSNTSALLTCADYHVPNYQLSFSERKCTADGNWTNKRPFSCSLECGIHRNEQEESSSEVEDNKFVKTLLNSFHWTAFMSSANYVIVCSAVLVHDLFLVTASECFSHVNKDKITNLNIGPVSLDAFKNLEAGKQYSAVQKYWIARTNNTANYEFAVVKLVPGFGELSDDDKPSPVCFSPGSISVAKMMESNITGKVLSFRKRKNLDGSIEEVFQLLDFQIVPKINCANSFPNFTIPSYAFCTHSLSGASLNSFEIGTGLYLQQKSSVSGKLQYVLKGIAIGPVMKPKKLGQSFDDNLSKVYQLFVNMETFHDWTLDVLEKYY